MFIILSEAYVLLSFHLYYASEYQSVGVYYIYLRIL